MEESCVRKNGDGRLVLHRESLLKLLKSCDTLPAATRIHSAIRHLLDPDDVFVLNNLIQMYGRCGAAAYAHRLFLAMPYKNCFSWELMLSVLATNGHLQQSKKFLSQIPVLTISSSTTLINVYASVGDIKQAAYIFHSIPQKDLVSWSTMVTAFAKNGEMQQAAELFDIMPLHDLISWTALLEGYGRSRDTYHDAKFLFHSIPEHDIVAWTTMLGICMFNQDPDEVHRAFAAIRCKDVVCYTVLLSASCQAGDLEAAERIFHDLMPEHSIVSWTAMLTAYAQTRNLLHARRLYERMYEHDVVSATCMVGAYSHAGNLEYAKYEFDSMPQRNLIAWNVMLGGFVVNGCLDSAKMLFDRMPEWDSVSSTAMVTAYSQAGKIPEAKYLFHATKEPNILLWNAMLFAHAQNSQLCDTKRFFDSMPEQDAVSRNILLVSFAYHGEENYNVLLELFHEVEIFADPDGISFICLLAASSHVGGMSSARARFVSMAFDYDMVPLKQHYCCMASSLGRCGHLVQARELLETMPFVADAVDWRSLLWSSKMFKNLVLRNISGKCVFELEPEKHAGYVLVSSIDT